MNIKFHYALATGLHSGVLRPASGTWGSLAAILFWYGIWVLFPDSPMFADIWVLIAIVVLGLYSTSKVLAAIQSGALPMPRKPKDPNFIVVDEWAGMWITLLGTGRSEVLVVVGCFFLFRALDVFKPYPIHALERLPGAWGIMLDDIAAGVLGLALKVILEPHFQILYYGSP